MLSLFCGLRSRYLKMERILLHQRHLIPLPPKVLRRGNNHPLKFPPHTQESPGLLPRTGAAVHPGTVTTICCCSSCLPCHGVLCSCPLHTNACFVSVCILQRELTPSKTSKLVSGQGWQWGVMEDRGRRERRRPMLGLTCLLLPPRPTVN